MTVTDITSWFPAKSDAKTVVWAKILVDRATDRIIGADLVGHYGEKRVQLFALAMTHDLTASQLRDSPTAYPTLYRT